MDEQNECTLVEHIQYSVVCVCARTWWLKFSWLLHMNAQKDMKRQLPVFLIAKLVLSVHHSIYMD